MVPVLVMMGGTDPAGATASVLEALADVDATCFVPVVVRPGVSTPAGLEAAALVRFSSTVWLSGVNARELAGWARVCRFAVSAAGGTLYELAALRLPFVSIVVAENQQVFAAEIEARWGMPRVVAGSTLRNDLAPAVRDLLGKREWPGAPAVDGRGAQRVADAMGA
jgi:spore coat polysaccharide biosynthesis predicted glycosyltransferase SpsG